MCVFTQSRLRKRAHSEISRETSKQTNKESNPMRGFFFVGQKPRENRKNYALLNKYIFYIILLELQLVIMTCKKRLSRKIHHSSGERRGCQWCCRFCHPLKCSPVKAKQNTCKFQFAVLHVIVFALFVKFDHLTRESIVYPAISSGTINLI